MDATPLSRPLVKRSYLIPAAVLALLLVAPAFDVAFTKPVRGRAEALEIGYGRPVKGRPVTGQLKPDFEWRMHERSVHDGTGGLSEFQGYPGTLQLADGRVEYDDSLCYLHPESVRQGVLCATHPWVVTFTAANPAPWQIVGYDWVINGDVYCRGKGEAWPGGRARRDPSFSDPRVVTCIFPTQGTYPVTLRVWTGRADQPYTQVTQDVRVKDLLIVSIGDSIGSGEGNPQISAGSRVSCVTDSTETGSSSCVERLRAQGYSQWQIERRICHRDFMGTGMECSVPPQWQHLECHRSIHAGPAQAAKAIADSDPHTSVTFLHLACSGATVAEGLLGPYRGQEQLVFSCPSDPVGGVCRELINLSGHMTNVPGYGLIDNRNIQGEHPILNECPYSGIARRLCYRLIPPQVDQVARYLCAHPLGSDESGRTLEACAPGAARQIDVLLISVGANDIGFGEIVKACAVLENCHLRSANNGYPSSVNDFIRAVENAGDRLADLPEKYEQLHNAISDPVTRKLDVANVFITEYHDPTKDENGNWCTHALDNVQDYAEATEGWLGVTVGGLWDHVEFDGLTAGEMEWAFWHVLVPLNNHVSAAAAAHTAHNWIHVSGLQTAFFNHGVCSSDKWVVNLKGSLRGQEDLDGTIHPNGRGHLEYSDAIADAVIRRLAQ